MGYKVHFISADFELYDTFLVFQSYHMRASVSSVTLKLLKRIPELGVNN